MRLNMLITFLMLFLIALIFIASLIVRKRSQNLDALLQVNPGVSPIQRWLNFSFAFLLLSLYFAFNPTPEVIDKKNAIKQVKGGDKGQQESLVHHLPSEQWAAVIDVKSADMLSRARFLAREEAQIYSGFPISLYQIQESSIELIVPPTYDLLYFQLLLEILESPSSRLDPEVALKRIFQTISTQKYEPLLNITVYTDQSEKYQHPFQGIQIIDVRPSDFTSAQQLEKSTLASLKPYHTNEKQAPLNKNFERKEFLGHQIMPLILISLALLLIFQGVCPKKMLLIAILFSSAAFSPSFVIGQETISIGPDVTSIIHSADHYYAQGDYQEALNILRGAFNATQDVNSQAYLLWNIALNEACIKDVDNALNTLDQVEERVSKNNQMDFEAEISFLREYVLYLQTQEALKTPDIENLISIINESQKIPNISPQFQNWLMIVACQLQSSTRLKNFTFSKASSVLEGRIHNCALSFLCQNTQKDLLLQSLQREVEAWNTLFSAYLPYQLGLYPPKVQTYLLSKIAFDSDADSIQSLYEMYLSSLFLEQEDFVQGMQNLLGVYVQSALWNEKVQSKSISSKILLQTLPFQRIAKIFIEGLFEAYSIPFQGLFSQDCSFASALADYSVFTLLFPQKLRFYSLLQALLGEQSQDVLLRAYSIIGIKLNVKEVTPEEMKNALIDRWIENSQIAYPSMKDLFLKLAKISKERSISQLRHSPLPMCLRLLSSVPAPSELRSNGSAYIDQVLPFFQIAIQTPFDPNISNTLSEWIKGLAICLDPISFSDNEKAQIVSALQSMLNASGILSTIAGNWEGEKRTWQDPMAIILDKTEVIYEILNQKPQVNIPPPSVKKQTANTSGDSFYDPIHLYKMLELRDRELLNQFLNMQNRGAK